MRNLGAILLIVTFFMFPVAAKAQLQADESLVLYFSFDEEKGDTAKDSSQYGNDGTIKGGVEQVKGEFGEALQFDGSTGYIEVPHSDSLNVEPSFTVENWGYPIDISREQIIAEKGFWAGNWISHIKTARGYVFAVAASGWNPIWLATSADSAFDAEKWYHMAMTWDGKTRKLYINGELDGEDEPTGSLKGNTNPVYIAGGRADGQHFYDGIYDEFRMWNRALSQDEIKASMEMGKDQLLAVNPLGKLAITWGSIRNQ